MNFREHHKWGNRERRKIINMANIYSQVKIFDDIDELNEWLKENAHLEVVSISGLHLDILVHYKIKQKDI